VTTSTLWTRFQAVFPFITTISLLLLILVPFPLVRGEAETVSCRGDFDEISTTGIEDDTTIYNSVPSIKITQGEAHIEMKNFKVCEIEFQAYFATSSNPLYIEITRVIDDEGFSNYIEVGIEPKTDGSTEWVKVSVRDKFEDNLETTETEKRTVDVTGEWNKCRIDIRDSKEETNRRELEVTIDGIKFVEGFLLISAELSTEVEVRNWNKIQFKKSGSSNSCYIDDLEVRTGIKTPYDVPWTLLIGISAGAYMLVAYKVHLFPFGQSSRRRKNMGGW